jgi:hypothetical protein
MPKSGQGASAWQIAGKRRRIVILLSQLSVGEDRDAVILARRIRCEFDDMMAKLDGRRLTGVLRYV